MVQAADLNVVPAEFHTEQTKKCPQDDPNAFKTLIGQFHNVDVASVTIFFDMAENSEQELVGMRAKLRQTNGKPRNCKPINKRVLKSAHVDSEGIMSLPFTCRESHANGVEIVARGSMCPTYKAVEVLTEEVVADWSDWTDWSDCDCETESRSRSRDCEGFGCPSETAVEVETCSDQCLQCDEGFEAVNNTVCVDIDECADDNACADGALCTNTEGAFDCDCSEEASFGDGFNFCMAPGPCHPGGDADECSCDVGYVPEYVLNTYWNSTETSCKFEYTIAPVNATIVPKSGSWSLGISFGDMVGDVNLWRGDVTESAGSYFKISPKSFNLDGMYTDMTLHFETSDGNCDDVTAPDLDIDYCTSPYVEPTTTTPEPVPEIVTEAVTEAPIVLGDEVCVDMEWSSSGGWDTVSAETETTIRKIQMNIGVGMDDGTIGHEWRIELNASGEIVEMTAWNHIWDGLNILTGKDYIGETISGHVSAGFIICTTQPDDFTLSPSLCFRPEL